MTAGAAEHLAAHAPARDPAPEPSAERHEALERRAADQPAAGYSALLNARPAGPQPIQLTNGHGGSSFGREARFKEIFHSTRTDLTGVMLHGNGGGGASSSPPATIARPSPSPAPKAKKPAARADDPAPPQPTAAESGHGASPSPAQSSQPAGEAASSSSPAANDLGAIQAELATLKTDVPPPGAQEVAKAFKQSLYKIEQGLNAIGEREDLGPPDYEHLGMLYSELEAIRNEVDRKMAEFGPSSIPASVAPGKLAGGNEQLRGFLAKASGASSSSSSSGSAAAPKAVRYGKPVALPEAESRALLAEASSLAGKVDLSDANLDMLREGRTRNSRTLMRGQALAVAEDAMPKGGDGAPESIDLAAAAMAPEVEADRKAKSEAAGWSIADRGVRALARHIRDGSSADAGELLAMMKSINGAMTYGAISGAYRSEGRLGGILPFKEIEGEMESYSGWLASALNAARLNPSTAIEAAAEAYQRLNSIHPFGDGNGRVCQMMMDLVLQVGTFPPATLEGSIDHVPFDEADPSRRDLAKRKAHEQVAAGVIASDARIKAGSRAGLQIA